MNRQISAFGLRAIFLSAAALTLVLLSGCQPYEFNANDGPTYGTAERMYGEVAAAHAEEDAEINKDWQAGGEPLPRNFDPDPFGWDYY